MFRIIVMTLLALQAAAPSPRKVTLKDIEFSYPSTFSRSDLGTKEIVALTNFRGIYLLDLPFPENGIEINVSVMNKEGNSFDQAVSLDSDVASPVLSRSNILLKNISGIKVLRQDSYLTARMIHIIVYLDHGKVAYRFALLADVDDSKRKSVEATLDSIVATVRFGR